MREMVFLNDRFLPLNEAGISLFSYGLLHGVGLFETMRSYKDKILYLDRHLERIKQSSRMINLPLNYSLGKLKNIISKIVRINNIKDACVRLSIWRSAAGVDVAVLAKKYRPYTRRKYNEGLHLKVSTVRQNVNLKFSRMKTSSRILYETIYQEAKKEGKDDTIILNNLGYITEASRSNLFFVKDKEIFTPSLDCGCLEGITRRAIIEMARPYSYRVFQNKFTIQDLFCADEAFLTNSLMGVMPLASIEKKQIGEISQRKMTWFFMNQYNILLNR